MNTIRTQIKKIFTLCLLSISIFSYAQVLDKTIATVTLFKTENISKTKLNKQLDIWERQTQQPITDDVKESVLTATINDILISQAADNAGIVATNQQINEVINQQKEALGAPISDKDFRELIKSQSGLEWEEYRDQVRTNIMQRQYIYKKYTNELENFSQPTERQIQETYDQYATQFTNPAMMRVTHLFWETENKNDATAKRAAEKIAGQINGSKEKFEDFLAKSLDDPSFDGGDLGYVTRDESTYRILGANFLDTIFSKQKDEVTGVVKSNLGYHIVLITDKRKAKLLDLDDPIFPGEKTTVRDRVANILEQQNQQDHFFELVKKEVANLRKKAKINILSKDY